MIRVEVYCIRLVEQSASRFTIEITTWSFHLPLHLAQSLAHVCQIKLPRQEYVPQPSILPRQLHPQGTDYNLHTMGAEGRSPENHQSNEHQGPCQAAKQKEDHPWGE